MVPTPSESPQTPLSPAEVEWICADAHRYADPCSDAWLDAATGAVPAAEALADHGYTAEEQALARELLAPFDPLESRQIVDHCVTDAMSVVPTTRVQPPPVARSRTRWWWFGGPVLAVAAAVTIVVSTTSMTQLSERPTVGIPEVLGQVQVTPTDRGTNQVHSGRGMFVDCGPADPSVTVLGITATNAAGGQTTLLRADPSQSSNGRWHAIADLTPGSWQIGCNLDRGSQLFTTTPATIEVLPEVSQD